ncbi:FAD-dependent oxidoreductase [Phytohabitans sp. LJ34]|uniref:FAD-dependent oxidoreductase n=1 Tax=Phytohabitans sp. LJ34 TaxID=3452217 RepID=UPI003F887CAE
MRSGRGARVVVVGYGMAGHHLVEELRRRGVDAPVTVLAAERRPAYNRVMLSAVLAGTATADTVELPRVDADLRLGMPAVRLDAAARRVWLADGTSLGYDHLVLATGSRPLLPPVPGLSTVDGAPAEGILTFRTVDDCDGIARLSDHGPVAVLGGGLLGVEAARGLAGRGATVVLVHPAGHLMERQLDPGAGAVLADAVRAYGVQVRVGVGAASWTPGPVSGGTLKLTDGTSLECAGVVVTAGVAPEVDLARTGGLLVRRGVVVDDRLATSAPGVSAIGECAEHRGRCYGLVEPCWEQARVLADLISGAAPQARYTGTPQVVRLKARGIDVAVVGEVPDAAGVETVCVSDAGRGRYGVLAIRAERLVGALLVGLPDAAGPVTRLLDSGAPVPADRLGLLLRGDTDQVTEPVGALPDAALICRCLGVTKGALVTARRLGVEGLDGVRAATRASTGCGGCARTLTELWSWLDAEAA